MGTWSHFTKRRRINPCSYCNSCSKGHRSVICVIVKQITCGRRALAMVDIFRRRVNTHYEFAYSATALPYALSNQILMNKNKCFHVAVWLKQRCNVEVKHAARGPKESGRTRPGARLHLSGCRGNRRFW